MFRLLMPFLLSLPVYADTLDDRIRKAITASDAHEIVCEKLVMKIQKVAGAANEGDQQRFASKKKALNALKEMANYPGISPEVKNVSGEMARLSDPSFEPVSPVTELKSCQPIPFFKIHRGLINSAIHFKFSEKELATLRSELKEYFKKDGGEGAFFIHVMLQFAILNMAVEEKIFALDEKVKSEIKALSKSLQGRMDKNRARNDELAAKLSDGATSKPTPEDKQILRQILFEELKSAEEAQKEFGALIARLPV